MTRVSRKRQEETYGALSSSQVEKVETIWRDWVYLPVDRSRFRHLIPEYHRDGRRVVTYVPRSATAGESYYQHQMIHVENLFTANRHPISGEPAWKSSGEKVEIFLTDLSTGKEDAEGDIYHVQLLQADYLLVKRDAAKDIQGVRLRAWSEVDAPSGESYCIICRGDNPDCSLCAERNLRNGGASEN